MTFAGLPPLAVDGASTASRSKVYPPPSAGFYLSTISACRATYQMRLPKEDYHHENAACCVHVSCHSLSAVLHLRHG